MSPPPSRVPSLGSIVASSSHRRRRRRRNSDMNVQAVGDSPPPSAASGGGAGRAPSSASAPPPPSAASSSSSSAPPLRRRRARATALLMLSVSLIHSDQNLLAPNLTAAAADLGLTDPAERDEKLGGGLALGLFLVGAPAALLLGAGSDGLLGWGGGGGGGGGRRRGGGRRTRRADLLALVLLIGAAGCAGSALARSYPALFVARAVTGVSLAGGFPIAMSLVSDLYGPDLRTRMSGRLGVAMNVGVLAGQTLAGWVGPMPTTSRWGGWRAPFRIVGALMVAAAYLVRTALPEPPRSAAAAAASARNADDDGGDDDEEASRPLTEDTDPSDGAEDFDEGGDSEKRRRKEHLPPTGLRAALRKWSGLLRIRTFWLLMLQGVPGCVPWGVIATFLPDYLHVDVGLTVHSATIVMGFFQLGGFIGTIAGSELGQRLYNAHGPTYPPLLMFAAGCLGVVPMWILIRHTPSHSVARCSLLALVGGALASVTGPNVRGTLSNVTESSQRGIAFASFILFDDVGKGAGPALVAALVGAHGRRVAFAASMLCWIPCAMLCGSTAWTVEGDQRRVSGAARMVVTEEKKASAGAGGKR